MKNTKKIILGTSLFLALGASYAPASVETLWAKGVSEAGGWVDFNKSNTDPNDDNLCWAAASSNIINWWQRQYDISEDVPKESEIWEKFKDSFTNEGSHPERAFRWWFAGDYTPPTPGAAELKDSGNRPAYYPYEEDCIDACMGRYDEMCDFIIGSLRDGCAMTLALSFMHEVTLWGIEYDPFSNDIKKLWLTDSDDYVHKIFTLDCYEYEYSPETGEAYLGVKGYPGRGDMTTYITMATTLTPATILQPIPEPSAFGLLAGLGALALVASRRRRK